MDGGRRRKRKDESVMSLGTAIWRLQTLIGQEGWGSMQEQSEQASRARPVTCSKSVLWFRMTRVILRPSHKVVDQYDGIRVEVEKQGSSTQPESRTR